MSVEIHIEWEGETHLVGRLRTVERSAAVSFEYTAGWLGRAGAFAIDPTSLPLRAGPHHSAALFGAMQDCGPDRWGRMLIERAVRKHVLERKPYQDLDYVLALDDASRIGALRFRADAAGRFLAASGGKIPPVVQLTALLNAANAVHGETETAQDLRFLLGQGSPLGGARPKSAVALADGQLAIAKFPKPDDVRDIAAGEILALTLAQRAGIQVPGHQLVDVKGKSVSVITRFDRNGAYRIPFLSAHSLLGLAPGEPGAYTLLADGIRQFGHGTAGDLRELWRRLVFSLLASNYDDHLRSHGFLMREPGRWALSPAYDLNPVPEIDRTQTPKTPITEEQEEPSIAAALASKPPRRKRSFAKSSTPFPVGARPAANSASKPKSSAPTPAPSTIRSWTKPDTSRDLSGKRRDGSDHICPTAAGIIRAIPDDFFNCSPSAKPHRSPPQA